MLRVVLALVLTLGVLAAPAAIDAQQPKGKVWRVGFLAGGARTPEGAPPAVLRAALKELGYIEEVVEACARLKGGRIPKEKLKQQLQKIAMKRTGGVKTDQILGHESGPEGLPHSIIVTPEGTEGEAPVLPEAAGAEAADAAAAEAVEPEARARGKGKTAKAAKAAKATKGKPAKGKTAKAVKAKVAEKPAKKVAKKRK